MEVFENKKAARRRKKIIFPKIYNANGDLSNNYWHIYFSYKDPITNRMIRYRKYSGINKHHTFDKRMEEAHKLVRKYSSRLKNGWSPYDNEEEIYEDNLEYLDTIKLHGNLKKGKGKLIKLINEFLTEKKPPITKKKTYQTYLGYFRKFEKWLEKKNLNNIHPSLFTEKMTKEYFDYVHKTSEKGQLAPATHNKTRTLHIALFNYIKAKKRVKKNPFKAIKPLKNSRQMPQFYNDAMQRAILKYLSEQDRQVLMAVKFIYYTYIRPGELRLIQIKHINFWDGTVFIPAEVSKNRKNQKVVMPEILLDELIRLEWNTLNREYYLFSSSGRPDIKPVGVNYFANRYRKYMREMNIPDEYELYSWKHTGAATALKQGINPEAIRQQMRHYDLRVTQEYLEPMIAGETSEFKHRHKPLFDV